MRFEEALHSNVLVPSSPSKLRHHVSRNSLALSMNVEDRVTQRRQDESSGLILVVARQQKQE